MIKPTIQLKAYLTFFHFHFDDSICYIVTLFGQF